MPAYATVLVAFFLRAYRLADQNVWWDEGWSVWLSQKDLAWIALRTAADEHPPLHYWVLHFWNLLAGTEAFAGRFLSVAFGVLTVALIYRMGKRMGGAWIGLLATLFLAVARFHIWWSQDIKNYTPSIFFAFAAVWFGLNVIARSREAATSGRHSLPAQSLDAELGIASSPRKPGGAPRNDKLWPSIFGYGVCAALALWTHYLAALVLIALNVYALLVWAVDRRGRTGAFLVQWIVSNLVAVVLFVPWLLLYLQNAAQWTAAPTFDFGVFLKLVATVLPLGVTTYIDNYAPLTLALTALALLGCVPGIGRQKAVGRDRSRPSAYSGEVVGNESPTGSPLLRGSERGIAQIADHPFYGCTTAFCLLPTLMILLPPLLIYILSLTPVAFFAPKIQARYLVVLLPAYALLLAFGAAQLRRFSIYLGLAAAIFVIAASGFVLTDYYSTRRLRDEYTTLANTINAFAQPGDLVLLDTDQEWPTFLYYLRPPLEWLGAPNGARMNAADADGLAQRALAQHRAMWLVAIPDALATDPQRLLESRLSHDLTKQFEQSFGDKRLVLYAASPRDITSVPPENFAPQHPYDEMTGTFIRFLGFDLPVHETRVGDTVRLVTYWSADKPGDIPIALRSITTKMAHVPAGKRVRVETDFVIPPSAVGILHIDLVDRELARLLVEPRGIVAGGDRITHPTDYQLGEAIHLAGYDLPMTTFHASESVSITLYWRVDVPLETSYTAFVHLLGAQFNSAQGNFLWGQVDRVPCDAGCPTTAWTPNETVPDVYRVRIDPHAPAGRYKIEVGLYDAATGARLPLADGTDSIILAEVEIR